MAKDPAFLFYPGDWLGGTIGMTFEEKGAYMELLMMQFTRGHMSGHMIGQTVGQLWVKVKDKFMQDDKGLWYNARLDLEKEKRKTYTASRKNNLSGKNQYTKNRKKVGHMTSHMENENRNVNDNINIKESKLEIFEKLFSEERYIEDLSIAHKGKDIKQAFEECYIHHANAPNPPTELGQWKQKLNTWLSNTKINATKNGLTKKHQSAIDTANFIADHYGGKSSH